MNSLILLAGCGLGDGSCIEETILTYLALEKFKCTYQIAAVDMQAASVNHISEETEGKRNVLVESARIGRGRIQNLRCVSINGFDSLVIPGGMGLMENYSNQILVRDLIISFHEQRKPIASMCAGIDFLRSILGQNVLREEYNTLRPDSFCCNQDGTLYYTPAFRMATSLCEVQMGIESMLEKMLLSLNREVL